jgi:hypothetical protein
MLKDGHLTEEEIIIIRQEANRLHLTIEEINALLETIVKEQEEERNKVNSMPLHVIAEKPELAVEHYKNLMGQIHQLALMTDTSKFEDAARKSDRLTASEMALWQQLQSRKSNA